mmetsp:Transcript_6652/g.21843  ORF Transcript_6652/g.21843 Transcript_6652/m.21843 type:complete len:392 (+) Transcript_6652:822-1997(+)
MRAIIHPHHARIVSRFSVVMKAKPKSAQPQSATMGASASRDADDADDARDDSPVYVAPACARERHWLLGTDGDAADIARALNDGGTRAADVLRAVRARCGDEGARHFARTHIVTDWDGPDWVLDATVDGEALLDARVATLALTSTSGEDARPRLIGSCFDDKDKEDGVVVEKASSSRTIMTPMLSYRLARELPKDRVREWRLAFDSDRHGASFRGAMLSRCQDIGPLIILIEPKNLHNTSSSDSDGEREVFVAHASPGLGAPRHDFGGDDFTRCWRFTPREGLVDIGSGTSAPTLYCASGFTQYLNGLGFFGRVGRHCLFVDEHLESGHVSYGARQFEIRRIEIWALTACERIETGANKDVKHAHAKAQAALITQFTASSINREARDAARS